MWEKLHRAVLQELSQKGLLDCSRACLESSSARTETGHEKDELTDPDPTDSGKKGTECHVLVTARDHLWPWRSLGPMMRTGRDTRAV